MGRTAVLQDPEPHIILEHVGIAIVYHESGVYGSGKIDIIGFQSLYSWSYDFILDSSF